ncbi:hypothetical protein [Hespellia stercorisuis]|uniref:DUF3899 domain-containing protein n=1 Tax=Hespellia stercorisuis DSM 15480 TaxID=1121950 RepID=A0A1M6U5F6_9FIRM|nr:hypothetical protein [Hespellia stercorisuis]SHK64400.1 hypothetical protein SAMN02745243_03405 [Hespellia stercorisuis DSM 15480]
MMMNFMMIIGFAFWLVGALFCVYQIYRMVELDARCRGLKHPKLWGVFSAGGNNQSGLILYLIGRKRFAIESMTVQQQKEMDGRKKKIGAGLVFLVLGAIICVWCIMLME